MFSQSHILAGVFGILASVGWILQAAGGGILYKRVSCVSLSYVANHLLIGVDLGLQEWERGYHVPSCE
jgi:hypothetical protein